MSLKVGYFFTALPFDTAKYLITASSDATNSVKKMSSDATSYAIKVSIDAKNYITKQSSDLTNYVIKVSSDTTCYVIKVSSETANYLKKASSDMARFITSLETRSRFHTGASQLVSNCISARLPLEKRTVALDAHPLQSLYLLLEKSILQQQQIPDLQERLETITEKLRNALVIEMNCSVEAGHEAHLFHAIKGVVETTLDLQPTAKKNAIFGTVYRLAGQPQTADLRWGERHAKEDSLRLIRALHRHECLEITGKQIPIYSQLEKRAKQSSCLFHLYRKELDQGYIGYHNGINNSLEDAKASAAKISDQCSQGHNIYCTYSATVNPSSDVFSAVVAQGGTCTPGVLQLLERWNDFFEQDPSHCLLQICHSRGAIEVYNALSHLPEEKRKRVIVIAVAPATFIPNSYVKKVINLVIPSDPIPKMALHQHIRNPHTMVLEKHANGVHPHYMLGSSYLDALSPLIERYIRTNEV